MRANACSLKIAVECGDGAAIRRDLCALLYSLGTNTSDFAARALVEPVAGIDAANAANAAILGDHGKAIVLAAGELMRISATDAEGEDAPVVPVPVPAPSDARRPSEAPAPSPRALRLPAARVLLARAVNPLVDELLAGMGRHGRHFTLVLLTEDGPHVVYCCSAEATVARAIALDVKVPQRPEGARLLVVRGDDAAWLALEELARFAPAGGPS